MTDGPARHLPGPRRPAWQPQTLAQPARGTFGLRSLPRCTLHRLILRDWPLAPLRIAVIADLHVCLPWVAPAQLRKIVALVNGLEADIALIAGDILADRFLPARHLPADDIVPLFDDLSVPLGVFSVLGNHDWKDCKRSRDTAGRENSVVEAYERSHVTLVRNGAARIDHGGGSFWLVMTDSDDPGLPGGSKFDREAAFAAVPPGGPAIHLAHEPDCFAEADDRAVLQISGHTHGGQGVLFGRRPMVPSAYGERFAIGHIVEAGRHLIVSPGIGYTGLPCRIGVPPEITLIEVSPQQDEGAIPP